MSLKNFQAYKMALKFYHICEALKIARHLKDQLNRASSSVPCNLAEGSEKPSSKDQRRFYGISLGSRRESEAILQMAGVQDERLLKLVNRLGGCIYRLVHPKRRYTG